MHLRNVSPTSATAAIWRIQKSRGATPTRITIDSDRMVRADVDGESIGQSPMSVTIVPVHLKVATMRRS
ncbi:hypothetical protein [Bradyrhizobium australiense]|uniref:Diacylglycerol kinase n=1 Tax=Bradyrhizobium australiense TaxID=2721161 RepID=A0A7Y4GSM1_9BRAD|nr:hypothetical protein [Bradyrhizobium australiense]NOJ41253.1 hypothetical protein [Bradyrhizobium australiense]